MINQQVPRHARRPSRKSPVCRTVTPQRPVHPKEHVLRQVLGFRAVAREPIANVKYAARVAAHKFLPGRAFALETLLDQLGILLQASSAPSSRHLLRQYPQVGFSACHCMERKMHRKCSRLGAVPTDRLAGILPAPAPTYNVFCYNPLELSCLSSLDATPRAPVLCFLMALKSRKALAAALGILVVGYLLYHFRGTLHLSQFSGAKLWEAVRRANFIYLLLSIVGIYGCYALRALRWHKFQSHLGPSNFWNVYRMTLAGFAALFLLGRAAEPVRPLLISRKDKIPLSDIFGIYALERILDAASTAVLAAVGLLIFESSS